MKTAILFILMVVNTTLSYAQSTNTQPVTGFEFRNLEGIEESADRLESELGDKAMVFETIGNHDGHSMYLVLRGKTGTAEFHITESDYYFGVRGNATFVIGGEVVNPEERPRKQIVGTSIKGGTTRALKPGDIIHVPPSTAHQIIISPDAPYMYILIKIDEEPLN